MKRKLCGFLLVALITVFIFALTSCDSFHEHNWSEWEIVKSPDCQNSGIEERFCDCGETQQRSIPTTSHIEGEWITQKESSCTNEGTKYKKCIECQKIVVTENIPIAHKYQNDLCVFCGCSNEKYFTFEQNPSGGYTIYKNKEATLPETIIIPSTYNGKAVTSIGNSAFSWCDSLESVTIPDSVTSIGDWAFARCYSLESVVIGDSVTSIGYWAFYYCRSLTEVYITNLSNWCNMAFSNSDSNPLYYADNLYLNGELVTNLVIPDDVTQIKSCVFFGCSSLVSVTIPDSVTSIGDDAFCGCSSLVSMTIPDSVTSIGDWAFRGCSSLYVVYNNSDLLLEIGSSNNGYLAYYAKILVDNGETIYANDGYNYTLTDDGFLFREKGSKYELISYIGGEDTVTLPKNMNGNSYDLYYMSGVVNVIIPESFTVISNYAFSDCYSLESVVIGDSVTSIGSYAFDWCDRLTSVVIGDSVTSIGYDAFRNCDSLESVTIPDSVTSIGYGAFSSCDSLVSVVIGDSVTTIGSSAFYSCSSLESVVIGDSVTSIGYNAFDNCSSLVSVVIGDSVTSIGNEAFDNCKSLTEVYYNGSAAEWNSISISSYNAHLQYATRYYYSETEPTEEGNFWHWVDGKVVVWGK